MGVSSIVAGAIEGLANSGVSIYNAWSTARNNKIHREREDNAVQRRVADLEKAGLSPTLAAGSAASSAPLSAPQLDKSEMVARFLAARQAQADYASTMANKRYVDEQIEYLREQKKSQILNNRLLEHDVNIYTSSPLTSKNNSVITGALRDLGSFAGWDNLNPLSSPWSPIGIAKNIFLKGKPLISQFGGNVANTTKEKIEKATQGVKRASKITKKVYSHGYNSSKEIGKNLRNVPRTAIKRIKSFFKK